MGHFLINKDCIGLFRLLGSTMRPLHFLDVLLCNIQPLIFEIEARLCLCVVPFLEFYFFCELYELLLKYTQILILFAWDVLPVLPALSLLLKASFQVFTFGSEPLELHLHFLHLFRNWRGKSLGAIEFCQRYLEVGDVLVLRRNQLVLVIGLRLQSFVLIGYLLVLHFYLCLLFLNAFGHLFKLSILIGNYLDFLLGGLHGFLKLRYVSLVDLSLVVWLLFNFLSLNLCSIASTHLFICKFGHLITLLLQHLYQGSLNLWCVVTWAIIQKLLCRIFLRWFLFTIKLERILLVNIWRLSTDRWQKTSLILDRTLTKCRFSHDCYGTILGTLEIDPLWPQLRILSGGNLLGCALLLVSNDRLADIEDVMTLLFIEVLFWLLCRVVLVSCFPKLVRRLNLDRGHLILHLLDNVISIQKVDGADSCSLLRIMTSLSMGGSVMRLAHIWLIKNAWRFVSYEHLLLICLGLHQS